MAEMQEAPTAARGGALYPCCRRCGGRSVMHDAWAVWDDTTHTWVLGSVFDAAHCEDCDMATTLIMQATGTPRERVRALNDAVRRGQGGQGRVLVTAGLKGRGDGFVTKVIAALRAFDFTAYDAENPDGAHDVGAFTLEGVRVFFKFDYFNPTLTGYSPDPADARLTERVLTVMLSEEY